MSGSWTLRHTVARDEPFLWRMLFYASHSDEDAGVEQSDIRENPFLAGYIEGWRLAGYPGVIAEDTESELGAAWLRVHGETDEQNPMFVPPDIPELAVAVLPGYEGQGIGTAMLEALLTEARPRFSAIVLSVRKDNPAVGLYRRVGFRPVEEITNRTGSRSLKMILDLQV